MEQELRRALQSQAGVKCSDTALLAQLGSAATNHGLTSKELASRLGAYLLNQKIVGGASISASTVDHFLSALARECNKENQARGAAATPGVKREAGRDWTGLADTIGSGLKPDQQGPPATPLAGRAGAAAAGATPLGTGGRSPATPQSAPRSAFKARTNRGQVVTTLNSHIPRAASPEARFVHAEPRGMQLPQRHLYLMERLEDKVAAVNTRIQGWRRALAAALAAAAAAAPGAAVQAATAAAAAEGLEVARVGVPVQEESYFVGRIVCEVEGGHLNDTAVVLEGDTALSEGARAHLDLSQLQTYRLFPGQVVAVKGVSPSGSRILAKHIWTHLPPPSPQAAGSTPAAADAMDVDGGSGVADAGLTVVVAAGPFSVADDLAYDPLHELLQDLKATPPNILVLLGPFVDVEQPLIAAGMINITFQQVFQSQVVDRLQAWQAALPVPCQVVLLPSVRDAFHHPTFPQPAIDIQLDQQLVGLQNPCSFAAGSVLLAATTTDVLRHLSSTELAKTEPGMPADRLGALASHVIGQRRFYPLYPAPPGTCLDLTADAALQLQQLPDLLLLPSDLAPFAKTVAAAPATATGGGYQAANSPGAQGSPQVVVVNPGRLTKGSSGGTYAHVTVVPGSGSLASRCRVDIVRV